MQGVQVWSLVKELRSLGPQNKTIKQKQHCDKFNTLKIVKKKKQPKDTSRAIQAALDLGVLAQNQLLLVCSGSCDRGASLRSVAGGGADPAEDHAPDLLPCLTWEST